MMTRRTVLKVAAAGAVTAFTGVVPGLKAFAETAVALRVRRSINKMALDDPDLETYRDFVGIMRAKSSSERVSWVGFANQHGDANNFKYCPHGDWYFLPWHRGFVDMYERTAAALTKNPKFAMPYWNWTTLRDYPQAFSDKLYKGKPNPLYVPGEGDGPAVVAAGAAGSGSGSTIKRNALTGSNALTDAIVGQKVMDSIYAESNFERFATSRSVDRSVNPPKVQNNLDASWVPIGGGNQGILERTPHNNVHNRIGGYMPQSNSPRDPIFMMHHGNIDRIWASWNSRGHKNTTEPLWLNMSFTDNYIKPDGTFYTKKVSDLLTTKALGYTYDDLSKLIPIKLDPIREKNLSALFTGAPTAATKRFPVPMLETPGETNVAAKVSLGKDFKGMVAAKPTKKPSEIIAVISNIQVPPTVGAINVFVNHPSVGPSVPETDPHFVTTIAFLHHNGGGDDAHAHHKSAPSTLIDLTETLQSLGKANALADDNVTVQLVPVPMPGVDAKSVGKVVPASIEIDVF